MVPNDIYGCYCALAKRKSGQIIASFKSMSAHIKLLKYHCFGAGAGGASELVSVFDNFFFSAMERLRFIFRRFVSRFFFGRRVLATHVP
jgi:hypothetical protein